jgi:MFS family permease
MTPMTALRHFFHDLAALPRDLKLLAASIFLWGTGESLFVYIVPLYMARLGASPAQVGNVYGLGAAAMGLSTIPAGILSDSWGRKQVMLATSPGSASAGSSTGSPASSSRPSPATSPPAGAALRPSAPSP